MFGATRPEKQQHAGGERLSGHSVLSQDDLTDIPPQREVTLYQRDLN